MLLLYFCRERIICCWSIFQNECLSWYALFFHPKESISKELRYLSALCSGNSNRWIGKYFVANLYISHIGDIIRVVGELVNCFRPLLFNHFGDDVIRKNWKGTASQSRSIHRRGFQSCEDKNMSIKKSISKKTWWSHWWPIYRWPIDPTWIHFLRIKRQYIRNLMLGRTYVQRSSQHHFRNHRQKFIKEVV